jgi:uncharacterized protein YgbK (DUF1537 family)
VGAILGAIADDFTGATDLAGMLVKQGLRTVQVIGVPQAQGLASWSHEVDAVVVALKTRTAPVDQAVADSRAALAWLQAQGCRRFISKVCSTFDSTPAGNIGPIAEALMDDLGTELALVCPAFPANARTVYRGHLFVGDALLSETGMRDHPLTPMTDANLVRVLQAQSRRPVKLLGWPVVVEGPAAVAHALKAFREQGGGFVIADAISDLDLLTLGLGCRDWPLTVAGSGLAIGLAAQLRAAGSLPDRSARASKDPPEVDHQTLDFPVIRGPALVIAGSCSIATQAQVERMRRHHPAWRIDPEQAMRDPDGLVSAVIEWSTSQLGLHRDSLQDTSHDRPILVYSTASAEDVRAARDLRAVRGTGDLHGIGVPGVEALSVEEAIEVVLARITQALVALGVRRLIIAGGETSGAVVRALGVRALRIGPEITPGVPWTATLDLADDMLNQSDHAHQPTLALALKSGNFGDPDFFLNAWSTLPC